MKTRDKIVQIPKVCAICGIAFTEWGNNPSPFPGETACNDCNDRFVLPARLAGRRLTDGELGLLTHFAKAGRTFVSAHEELRRQAREGTSDK